MQNIQSISTKDLRDNLAEVLEQVAIAHRSFVVEKFGKQKAVINPISTLETKMIKKIDFSKLPAYGIWKNRKDMKNPVEWVKKIREKNSRQFSI